MPVDEELLELLRAASSNPQLKMSVGMAASTLGWPELLPTLRDLVADKDPNVAREATAALAKIQTDEATELLVELLDTPGPVGSMAMYEIRVRQPAAARSAIRSKLEASGGAGYEDLLLIGTFGLVASDEDVPFIVELSNANDNSRLAAASALAQMCTPKSIEAMLDLARSGPVMGAGSFTRNVDQTLLVNADPAAREALLALHQIEGAYSGDAIQALARWHLHHGNDQSE